MVVNEAQREDLVRELDLADHLLLVVPDLYQPRLVCTRDPAVVRADRDSSDRVLVVVHLPDVVAHNSVRFTRNLILHDLLVLYLAEPADYIGRPPLEQYAIVVVLHVAHLQILDHAEVEGCINERAVHEYLEQRAEQVELVDVLRAFVRQSTKRDQVLLVVEEMHFEQAHLTDHKDPVAANIVA